MGAILLEGTERVTIEDNLFTKLDSNAIFLSGYNRDATIASNEFVWLGQSAIAAWGRANENDGTNGDQPRGRGRGTRLREHDLSVPFRWKDRPDRRAASGP